MNPRIRLSECLAYSVKSRECDKPYEGMVIMARRRKTDKQTTSVQTCGLVLIVDRLRKTVVINKTPSAEISLIDAERITAKLVEMFNSELPATESHEIIYTTLRRMGLLSIRSHSIVADFSETLVPGVKNV